MSNSPWRINFPSFLRYVRNIKFDGIAQHEIKIFADQKQKKFKFSPSTLITKKITSNEPTTCKKFPHYKSLDREKEKKTNKNHKNIYVFHVTNYLSAFQLIQQNCREFNFWKPIIVIKVMYRCRGFCGFFATKMVNKHSVGRNVM